MEHVFPPPGTLLVTKRQVQFFIQTSNYKASDLQECELWQTPWSNEKNYLEVGEPVLFLGLHSFKTQWDTHHLSLWEVNTVYCWKVLLGDKTIGIEISEDMPSQDLFESLFEIRHA